MMRQKPFYRDLWLVLLGLLILTGIFLLAAYLIPYDWLKPVADSLARDGSLERFTPSWLSKIKPWMLVGALLLFIAGSIVFISGDKIQNWLSGLQKSSPRRAIARDIHELNNSIRSELQYKQELVILGFITILAAVIRALYLSQPMQHDEAYTFIAFASRPFQYIISDYSLPNNHVFHTILVYLAYHLLGNQPWIIRLPAFVAGVITIPATYAAATLFYNSKIGLLSSGLVASSPVLIDYSANARGYTIICMFTLMVVVLAAYVKDHPNLISWALLVSLSCMGFYTIPIMLYPFGMAASWLLISFLLGDTSARYGTTFWKYLVASVFILTLLTALLYTPIFIKSGIGSVINNSYVRPDDPTGSLEQIWSRVSSTREQWLAGVPPVFGWLSGLGFFASLALNKRISSHKLPLQVAAILWIALAITVQRVAPLARVWMFLLPLYIIWASAGALGLIRLVIPVRFHPQAARLVYLLAILIPGLLMASSVVRAASTPDTVGAEEETALFFRENLEPGDTVVVQSPIATPLEYYFQQYGLPPESFEYQSGEVHRLWVVASTRYGQTVQSVLTRRGFAEYAQTTQAKAVHQYKHITVFELVP